MPFQCLIRNKHPIYLGYIGTYSRDAIIKMIYDSIMVHLHFILLVKMSKLITVFLNCLQDNTLAFCLTRAEVGMTGLRSTLSAMGGILSSDTPVSGNTTVADLKISDGVFTKTGFSIPSPSSLLLKSVDIRITVNVPNLEH